MTEHAEIKAKLTLDENASKTLEHVKEGFEHVKEKVAEVGHELIGMAKQAAVFAVGFQLSGAIESVKEFGEELIHSASQAAEERKELESLLELSDKGGASFDELNEKAGELSEELEGLAIQTGNTKGVLIDAFGDIASRSTQSAEHTEEMVKQMAMAAKNLPGGVQTLSNAWRDLETGIIRPKNALVQMIRQAGIATGSAKDVAKGLSAMVQQGKQQEVFELAEKAIGRMANRMKDVPLTFDQMLTSLKGYREMLFETMGAPILKAIGPQLDKLRDYFAQHREEFVKLATTLGTRVGEWVKKAAEMIQKGFEYLETHADDIMDAIEQGANALKTAIAFVVDHKELLLAIFAGYKGSQIAGGIAGALPGIGMGAGKFAGQALAGTGFGGMAVTAAGLAVIDAAVLSELEQQTAALTKESGGLGTSDLLTTMNPFAGHFGGGEFADMSDEVMNVKAAFEAMNDPARQSAEDTRRFADQVIEYANALKGSGLSGELMKEVNSMKDVAEARVKAADVMFDTGTALVQATLGYADDFSGPQLDVAHRMADTYRQMAALDAQAAEQGARQILEGNAGLVAALGVTGDNVEEALQKLKSLAGGEDADKKLKMPAVNFGPSSFTIKQDFRDVDPDRIMVLFKRDIAKNAGSRVASRMGTPFGF